MVTKSSKKPGEMSLLELAAEIKRLCDESARLLQSPLLSAENRLVHDGFDPSDDLYEVAREAELFDGANEAHEPIRGFGPDGEDK